MADKYVYFFGGGKADGNATMKNLLGGKGANLAEMVNLQIPVPPGFTISTDICTYFYVYGETYPPELKKEVEEALQRVEQLVGAKFGDAENPLLVSVRSGAASSMPGMMDTILNLGLNDETIQGVIRQTQDERFAYDCYAVLFLCMATWCLDSSLNQRMILTPLKKSSMNLKRNEGWNSTTSCRPPI